MDARGWRDESVADFPTSSKSARGSAEVLQVKLHRVVSPFCAPDKAIIFKHLHLLRACASAQAQRSRRSSRYTGEVRPIWKSAVQRRENFQSASRCGEVAASTVLLRITSTAWVNLNDAARLRTSSARSGRGRVEQYLCNPWHSSRMALFASAPAQFLSGLQSQCMSGRSKAEGSAT